MWQYFQYYMKKNKYIFLFLFAFYFMGITDALAVSDPIDTCWYIVRKDGKQARCTYGKTFFDKNDTAFYYTRSSNFKKKKKKEDFEFQIPLSNVSQIKNCMGAVWYQDTAYKKVAQGKLSRAWNLFNGHRYYFDNNEIPDGLFWQHIQACSTDARKAIKITNAITIAYWVGYLIGAIIFVGSVTPYRLAFPRPRLSRLRWAKNCVR